MSIAKPILLEFNTAKAKLSSQLGKPLSADACLHLIAHLINNGHLSIDELTLANENASNCPNYQ